MCVARERFRQPEVQHFDFSFGRHLHIGGLQVAMDDSFLVRGFQCFGNLFRDAQRFFDWNRPVSSDSLR